jgi:hypothetical protein
MPSHQLPVPRTQDLADLARVIRRAEVSAQAPSGVAGAPRIERFLSNSNLESPVETALPQTALPVMGYLPSVSWVIGPRGIARRW